MTFRHHPDGWIYVGNLVLSLAEFLAYEPDYQLPEGMNGREYAPGVRHVLYDTQAAYPQGMPWLEGDNYLSREAVYATAHQQKHAQDGAEIERNRQTQLAEAAAIRAEIQAVTTITSLKQTLQRLAAFVLP